MHYRKATTLIVFFIMLINSACYSKKQPVPIANNGFAVVELFTSEGCSSCPAAEAALAAIHDEGRKNVYVMEFHVDYWDHLGWKDVFSSSEYTHRQQQYAAAFHLNSTYTPQAIVNGKNELVGSDRSKLRSLINGYLQKAPLNKIGLNISRDGSNVTVKYVVANKDNQELNIALVQKEAQTDVKRGENTGRQLNHINVVRALKTVEVKEDGSLNILLPPGLSANDCKIIAFTNDGDSMEVTGAAEAAIN